MDAPELIRRHGRTGTWYRRVRKKRPPSLTEKGRVVTDDSVCPFVLPSFRPSLRLAARPHAVTGEQGNSDPLTL